MYLFLWRYLMKQTVCLAVLISLVFVFNSYSMETRDYKDICEFEENELIKARNAVIDATSEEQYRIARDAYIVLIFSDDWRSRKTDYSIVLTESFNDFDNNRKKAEIYSRNFNCIKQMAQNTKPIGHAYRDIMSNELETKFGNDEQIEGLFSTFLEVISGRTHDQWKLRENRDKDTDFNCFAILFLDKLCQDYSRLISNMVQLIEPYVTKYSGKELEKRFLLVKLILNNDMTD